MNPTPYVMFKDGQCREAMRFYAELFGGTVSAMMRVGDGPMDMPPEKADMIMHSVVTFSGGALMGCDDMMGHFEPMAGNSISMQADSVEAGQALFDALAEQGGEVSMAYQKTFFSPGFGTVRDRYGINWMIVCGMEASEG